MVGFDHHRAEITVMQFTGHPLPVHQFVTVPRYFNPVPYCQPSSPTPTEYATSAVFGMACLAGSEVNIQQSSRGQVIFYILFSVISRTLDLGVRIEWSVFFTKSKRILWVSFSWTDSGLCVYHLVVWSTFNLLQNFQWSSFPLSYP